MTELLNKQQVLDTLRKTAGVGKRVIDAVEALPIADCYGCKYSNMADGWRDRCGKCSRLWPDRFEEENNGGSD